MKMTFLSNSSKGNQEKIFYSDSSTWIKFDYLGYESMSEVLISKILQQNHIDCIDYNFIEQDNKIGCISKDMRSKNDILISVRKLMHQESIILANGLSTKETIKNVVDFIIEKTNIKDFGIYLSNLLYIDYIFLNEDRHLNNVVLIYNTDTRLFKPSPIFDNGASLLSDITQDYPLGTSINNLIRQVKAKPFSTDFKKQVEAINELYPRTITVKIDMDYCKNILKSSPYTADINNRVLEILQNRSKLTINNLQKTHRFI